MQRDLHHGLPGRYQMLIKQAPDIRSSEITPERVYRNRRQFIQTTSGAVAGAIAGGTVLGRYDGAARRPRSRFRIS